MALVRSFLIGAVWCACCAEGHDPHFFDLDASSEASHVSVAATGGPSLALYFSSSGGSVVHVNLDPPRNPVDEKVLLYVELLVPTSGHIFSCEDIDFAISFADNNVNQTAALPAVVSSLPICNQCPSQRLRVALPVHCCTAKYADEIMYEPFGISELQTCAIARGEGYQTVDSLRGLRVTVNRQSKSLPFVLALGCREEVDWFSLGVNWGWILERVQNWSLDRWYYNVTMWLCIGAILDFCTRYFASVRIGEPINWSARDVFSVETASYAVLLVFWSRLLAIFVVTDCNAQDGEYSQRLWSTAIYGTQMFLLYYFGLGPCMVYSRRFDRARKSRDSETQLWALFNYGVWFVVACFFVTLFSAVTLYLPAFLLFGQLFVMLYELCVNNAR